MSNTFGAIGVLQSVLFSFLDAEIIECFSRCAVFFRKIPFPPGVEFIALLQRRVVSELSMFDVFSV
jgi:hypothetical protein